MSIFDLHARNVPAEAAAWLARLRADDRSVEDEREFHKWLGKDARHATAFEEINAIWDGIGSVRRDMRTGQPYLETRWNRRHLFLGVGAVVGLGATAGLVGAAQAKVYQTDVGEQKHVVLDDGTSVLLDTDTKLAVRFGIGRREVELQYGRANFRTGPETKNSFTVKANRETITSSHSTFDVSRDADRVSVVLIYGNAVVETRNGQPRQELASGQQLLVTNRGSVKLDKPYLLQLLAWQTGQAVFENNSVSDAVHEMNRYSLLKLQIVDDRIADMRVSGVYRVGDNTKFALSLSRLLPISLRQVGNGIELRGNDFRPTQG